MANRGPFRNLPGAKHKSPQSALISLHFNKADEDQLEFNYADKDSDSESLPSVKDEKPESSSISLPKQPSSEDNSIVEDEGSVENGIDTAPTQRERHDSTSSKDSVIKEYLSRISRRACSVDSETGSLEKKDETWPFLKDIKGRITKTLEERKSKEPKNSLSDDLVKTSESVSSESICSMTDSDRTPTEGLESTDDSHLSPAIEAAELISDDNSVFDNYVDDELDKAKCEILSKVELPFKKKKLHPEKPNFKMTLSSLKANRSLSEDGSESKSTSSTPKVEISNTEDKELDKVETPKKTIFVTSVLQGRKSYYYYIESCYNSVIFYIIIASVACAIAPIPSWFSGFFIGILLAGFTCYSLFKPGKPRDPFVLPNYNQMPPLTIPISKSEEEPIIHKGWMNELPIEYNSDTYHVNCTHSAYIRLDGSYLRISYPKSNIPKRAMFNEARHDLHFVHQLHYDITDAMIELLPKGLAKKRLWSKKYPICLRIPNRKHSVLSSRDSSDSFFLKTSNPKESPTKKYVPRVNEDNEVVLHLFSRTDRDKDVWFNRFKNASKMKLLKPHSPSSSPNIAAIETSSLENKRTISVDLASIQLCSSYDIVPSSTANDFESFTDVTVDKQLKFNMYMSHLMSPQSVSNLMWLNALIGRVFFDFLTEKVWANAVATRIQRKLSKIKLPHFLEELTVRDINLGTSLPKIHRASDPVSDQQGLWVDIDLSYNGSFQMTLETKLNLLRLAKSSSEELMELPREGEGMDIRSHIYSSEEDDTAESSSDEDIPLSEINEGAVCEESIAQAAGGSTSKKILRLVDRFAQSTYFQNAAKNKFFKRYMAEVSNTPLVLTVEIHWLTGTLAINIPPMPTDRLWYGFRKNPHLSIVARPKLGEHVVTLTHVTEWIEKKLVSEFQKILVMPNMDDLIIPIMQCDADLPKT